MGRATAFRQRLISLTAPVGFDWPGPRNAELPTTAACASSFRWIRLANQLAAAWVLRWADAAKAAYRKKLRASPRERQLRKLLQASVAFEFADAPSDYSSSDGSYFESD